MKKSCQGDIDDLKRAIRHIYNYKVSHAGEVAVIEKHGSNTVWGGIVHIFKIKDHPKTDTCYAWASPIEGSAKMKYYAALKILPIDSPEKAVRAAIIQDYKKTNLKKRE